MSRISKLLERDSNPVKFVEPKLFVPVDCQVPETPKSIMARTMLQSGLISRDEYDTMLGVTFDIGSESEETFDDFGDWEDDFKVSQFAEYEEYEVENVQEKEISGATEAVAQPDSSVEQSENTDGSSAE